MQQMEQERTASAATSTPAGEGARPGQPATQSAHGPTEAAPAPTGTTAPAGSAGTSAPATPSTTAPTSDKITIDDFLKVELRVGQVKAAEKVKGADKLLRLEVDIGTEVRQLVAGIALAYSPESLIGRKVVIVANLQPRKLRGLESNGMIVAASAGEDGKPVLASFLEDVPIGAKLK
jgi:methionyl-tRNA synthetase